MELSVSAPLRIRVGAAVLGLGAVAFLVAQLVHPANPMSANPSLDPRTAALDYSSSAYLVADLLFIGAFVALGIGSQVLYVTTLSSGSEPLGFWSLVLIWAGIGLLLSFLGTAAFTFPVLGHLYLQGRKDAFAPFVVIWNGPGVTIFVIGWALLTLGALGMGFALRTTDSFLQGLYAVGILMYPITDLTGLAFRVFDALLVAGGWLYMAWVLWRMTWKPPLQAQSHTATSDAPIVPTQPRNPR
jgi:hypothetical protein